MAAGCASRIELPGRTLALRVWRALVGRTTLYLLDSNDPLNGPVDRGITGKLYGGGGEMRLMQEIVLGIGGWRADRGCCSRSRGLPSQRRACGLRGARAGAIVRAASGPDLLGGAMGDAGRQCLHHPYRRCRRASTVIRPTNRQICRSHLRRSAADGDCAARTSWRLGTTTATDADEPVQHGLSGAARLAAEPWRQPAASAASAGEFSSRCFRAGRSARCRSITSPTACTCRHGIRARPTRSGPLPAARIAGAACPTNWAA